MLQRKIIDFVKEIDTETLEKLKVNSNKVKSNQNSEKLSPDIMWHSKLAHASINCLKRLEKSEEQLKNVKFDNEILNCEKFVVAKMQKQPFSENRTRADESLGRIHTDCMGPIKPLSHPRGNKYIIIFVDDYILDTQKHMLSD